MLATLALALLAAIPSVPKRMYIGQQVWTISLVETVSHNHQLSGKTECIGHVVFLERSQEPYAMADTLVHEIEHAFTCGENGNVDNGKWNNWEDEHEGIYWSAPIWADFIANNPDVIAYIAAARKLKD
jgi:hypothetical protein